MNSGMRKKILDIKRQINNVEIVSQRIHFAEDVGRYGIQKNALIHELAILDRLFDEFPLNDMENLDGAKEIP
jgi:chorismate mutase